MRWPLRNQMLLPATCLMLASLIAVSTCNAWISARRARLRIEGELNDVAQTLADASFPLSDSVLQKMKGLSGAEFVLLDRDGRVTASSSPHEVFEGVVPSTELRSQTRMAFGTPITLNQGRYFQGTLDVRRMGSTGSPATLHILYPEGRYHEVWRDAVYPPLVVGTVAILLVIAVGSGIASRVTQPLQDLQIQVNEIAQGDFKLMPIPARDDEIADLSRSINRMSETLTRLEDDVRRNERLRTLGQLGAGIAHQIRNSVTGCRLAIELHSRECPLRSKAESLEVATRQLELMETYLRRFMSLGSNEIRRHELTDLVPVVNSVVSLVGPTARHMNVELQWTQPEEEFFVIGGADALEQLLVNLLLNAIEAAAQMRALLPASEISYGSTQRKNSQPDAMVRITLRHHGGVIALTVEDSGAGPPVNVQDNLFDPFVSEKRDGTGLGLTVAQEIAMAHNGRILWRRNQSTTDFVVELPNANASVHQATNQILK